MLNSRAPGVTVVNVDNGFGAGVAASMINRAKTKILEFQGSAAGDMILRLD